MSYVRTAYRKTYSNTGIITAGLCYTIPITDIERNEYGPFKRLTIVNNSGSATYVYINGYIVGPSTVSTYEYLYSLPADSTLMIEPADNIFISLNPIVKNVSGSNIEVGKIIAMFQNY